jgi:hypothetical protein
MFGYYMDGTKTEVKNFLRTKLIGKIRWAGCLPSEMKKFLLNRQPY